MRIVAGLYEIIWILVHNHERWRLLIQVSWLTREKGWTLLLHWKSYNEEVKLENFSMCFVCQPVTFHSFCFYETSKFACWSSCCSLWENETVQVRIISTRVFHFSILEIIHTSIHTSALLLHIVVFIDCQLLSLKSQQNLFLIS